MLYPNINAGMNSRGDLEICSKLSSLVGRWGSEDRWHSSSSHVAQTSLRSWTHKYGDDSLSLLYAQWKNQVQANQSLRNHMTTEMHQAASMLLPLSVNPEQALTPAIRAMAEVQSYLATVQAEIQQMNDTAESQVAILVKESREFQDDVDEIMEMIRERVEISRRKMRTSPLHHINEETTIDRYQQIEDVLQSSCKALLDADGAEMLKHLNSLRLMSKDWHDDMPAVCNSIAALSESSSDSDSVSVLAGLPLQLVSDMMRMNQLVERMSNMWQKLGQESDQYFLAAQSEV